MPIQLTCTHDYPPTVLHYGDVGLDLRSPHESAYILHPGEITVIDTEVFIEYMSDEVSSYDYWLQLCDKSGIAKRGIHVLGGVIDNGYKGSIRVVLVNLGRESYTINQGDSICQAVVRLAFYPYKWINLNGHEVKPLSQDKRGADGGVVRE